MSTKPPSPVVPTKDSRVVRLVRTVRPAMLDGVPVTPEHTEPTEAPPPPAARIDIRVSTVDELAQAPPPTPSPHIVQRKKGERVDWDALEVHYRTGLLSLKMIGALFGISAPAIVQHAKRQNPPWIRDISSQARAKADTKVQTALVNSMNAEAPTVNGQRLTGTELSVETYSDVLMRVRMGQHGRFKRVAALCMEMFEELEEQVAARPLLKELGDLMLSPNEAGIDRLNDMYRKVIEFPGQVRAMKDLADVIGQLTAWESRAFRLDTAPLDGTNKKRNLTVRFVDAPPMVERVEGDDDGA